MLAILNLFGPIAVRLIGKWLDKVQANAELRAAYLAFKTQMQSRGLIPVEARDEIDRQRADLDRIANGTGQPVDPKGKDPLQPRN